LSRSKDTRSKDSSAKVPFVDDSDSEDSLPDQEHFAQHDTVHTDSPVEILRVTTVPTKEPHAPRPIPDEHERALKEMTSERLNSPTKSTSRNATPQNSSNDKKSAPSSEKAGQATTALAAMLEAKRASRADSRELESVSRRQRTTLGRAISNGTENLRLSRQNSPHKAQNVDLLRAEAEEGQALPLQSQKIIYEDQVMRDRRERLLAELGGDTPELEAPKEIPKRSRRQTAKKKRI